MGRKVTAGLASGFADISLGSQSDVRFSDADSSNFVAIQGPATIASNYTLTLPDAVASSNGFVLTSDTSGVLTWASAGATVATPSTDATFYPTFNDTTSGAFDTANVSTGLTYNPSSNTLGVTNLSVSGTTELNEISEVLNVVSGYGTSQTVAYSAGNLHLLQGLSGNYTFNWNGVPTTTNRTYTLTNIIQQGGTPYIPSTLQINGSGVTINWAGNVTPSGQANRINIIQFIIYYTGSFTCAAALGSY
jgi:hypothetical protein